MKRKIENREWIKGLAMAFTAVIFSVALVVIIVSWLAAHLKN